MNDSMLGRFFGVVVRPRTWLNVLFQVLAFPLGLFYFIFLVTGSLWASASSIIWVGIPILLVVAGAWWLFGAFERVQAKYLLGADVPLPPRAWETVERRVGQAQGPLRQRRHLEGPPVPARQAGLRASVVYDAAHDGGRIARSGASPCRWRPIWHVDSHHVGTARAGSRRSGWPARASPAAFSLLRRPAHRSTAGGGSAPAGPSCCSARRRRRRAGGARAAGDDSAADGPGRLAPLVSVPAPPAAPSAPQLPAPPAPPEASAPPDAAGPSQPGSN